MKTRKRTLALLLALVFALGTLTACGGDATTGDKVIGTAPDDASSAQTGNNPPDSGVQAEPSPTAGVAAENLTGVRAAASYDELYESVNLSGGWKTESIDTVTDAITSDTDAAGDIAYSAAADTPASFEMSQSETSAAADSADTDYTGTNTQVDGVDEGDIVKTDGTYLYILRDGVTLTIVRADGENTAVVSETRVCEDETDGGLSVSCYGSELYLAGDRVAVLYESYRWGYDDEHYTDTTTMGVRIYDVSDPSAPVLAADLAQDGYLSGSRVADGVLYLVTNYYVYDADQDDPYGYVPCIYESGEACLMPCDCIFIPETRSSAGYAVVQAIDLTSGTSVGELSVLGGCDTLYMSRDNLYLIAQEWAETEGEPYTEDGYTVREYTSAPSTQILRVAASGGLTLAASGTVSGYPLGQYSFDETDGCFRAVVSTNESVYRLYSDEKHGWTNYESISDEQNCALYVFDLDLKEISHLTGLADDERVYSVRFDGDMVYFVTFRETDPLFAVDLSDPAAPAVKSALKLPGYSSYLHIWSDGLLFGLGQDVGEESNRTEGIKLAMYDNSDPENLRELVTTVTDFDYSPAESDAKALCIDPEKNVIGFAAEAQTGTKWTDYYVIFTYENGAFSELGRYELSDWIYNIRGARIGENLYICGDSEIIVVSLATGAEVQHLLLTTE